MKDCNHLKEVNKNGSHSDSIILTTSVTNALKEIYSRNIPVMNKKNVNVKIVLILPQKP
jgi:hypothetical protein